jgi:hypothetical protein
MRANEGKVSELQGWIVIGLVFFTACFLVSECRLFERKLDQLRKDLDSLLS